MNALFAIGAVGIYALLCVWLYRHRKRARTPRQTSDLYFREIYDNIHKLSDDVDRLEELENLITDIECCNAEYLKSVRIDVPDTLYSKESRHEFVINGNDENSKYLLQIAYAERDKLRSSLLENIGKIFG